MEEKKLPKNTRLLDLTRERNGRMEADPWSGDPRQTGIGTRYALTLAAVAPEVELLLVRVDPSVAVHDSKRGEGDQRRRLSFAEPGTAV